VDVGLHLGGKGNPIIKKVVDISSEPKTSEDVKQDEESDSLGIDSDSSDEEQDIVINERKIIK
jgi:hypothetical protein